MIVEVRNEDWIAFTLLLPTPLVRLISAAPLHQTVTIPIHRSREAWSSQEAARFAPQGQKHNDSAAAAIILQRFLDSHTKAE